MSAALALLASTPGCQTAPGGVDEPGVPIAADDAQVRGLLAALQNTMVARTALRATAKLSLDGPQLRFSRPQRVVLEAPASLRMEVLGLFDQVAGVVATDGERFGFIDLLSGAREFGPVDDGLLWRTARVDLTPSEAVSLLLGYPPLGADVHVLRAVRFADGAIGALVRSATGEHWLEWESAGGLRRAELKSADGSVRWDALFADPRALGDSIFAHSIELKFPRVDATVRLDYHVVELQPELSRSLFVLQVPAGE